MKLIFLSLLLAGCTSVFVEPAKFEVKQADVPLVDTVVVKEVKKPYYSEPTPFKTGREVTAPPACLEARKNGSEC